MQMHSKNTKNEILNEYVVKSSLSFMFKGALCLIKANVFQKASPSALKVMHSLSGRYVIV